MGNEEQKSIQTYNVHICKKDNLVYLASLKAASTYYKSLFISNGWECIEFKDIDWVNHHVFGFITDPVTRYMKAVTEDFFNEETPQFIADIEFQDLLRKILGRHRKQCFVLTHHSLPLSMTLGDYARKVDWIPLDDKITSNWLFTKLCEKYKIEIDYSLETIDKHVSTEFKLDIYDELKTLFGPGNYFRDIVLAKDIDLYNEVKSKINLIGSTWDEISWIRNQS